MAFNMAFSAGITLVSVVLNHLVHVTSMEMPEEEATFYL
jgi:hypothetical protein